MPIFDFSCSCGFASDDLLVSQDQLEEGIFCPSCEKQMVKAFPLSATFKWKKEQTATGIKHHGGNDRRQEMQKRYKKREKWYNDQPPEIQNRLNKFARKYNVRSQPSAHI